VRVVEASDRSREDHRSSSHQIPDASSSLVATTHGSCPSRPAWAATARACPPSIRTPTPRAPQLARAPS